MPSTVQVCLARIEHAIVTFDHERDRRMLTIYRDHWWAEVRNDVDAIMATLPEDIVDYRFEGAPMFFAEPSFGFAEPEGARALYMGAAASGLPMAGPFDEERPIGD